MVEKIDEIELLASVFESSLDAIVILFSNGRIHRANRAAERLFLKNGEEDMNGKNIFSMVSGESKTNLKNFLAATIKTKKVHSELVMKLKGDSWVFDVTGNASIIDNLHLIIMRDITEKVREREAREQFIAIAGHELKTPLAVISAYSDLLKRKYKEDAAMHIYLNKITGKSKVLTNYIESILDEIRIGTGRFSFEDKEYKFDAVVKEVIQEIRSAYPDAKIVEDGETKKMVKVDRERISQVIRNLVINAINHSTSGKEINVEIKKKNGSVYFAVTNKGKGIPAKEHKAIFKAFYRSGTKSSQKKSGLGLGLYIAKQIVNHYEGSIGVESKVGRGAKFYFEIPYIKH